MASFYPAYQLVAKAEGGYQRIPEDSGNYNSRGDLVGTNWGISAPVYEDWIGRPPSTKDMQNISLLTAHQIYKSRFWDDIDGDSIQSQEVANIFFDGRVNHGRTGTKLMQKVLGVNVDGVVGNQTLSAINRANPTSLFNRYKAARRQFYYDIVNRKPSQRIFLNGWLNRLNKFEIKAAAAGSLFLIGLGLVLFYGFRD